MRWCVICALLIFLISKVAAFSLLSRLKGAIKSRANIIVFRGIIRLEAISRPSYTGLKSLLSGGNTYTGVGVFVKQNLPVKNAVLSRLTSWLIKRAIYARTKDTRGLRIKIDAGSSVHVAQGRLGTIEIIFDLLSSSEMQVSGGGKITISDFQVDLKRLLFNNLQFVRNPYTVHCDLHLTQDDILSSNVLKSLTQKMANIVLERTLGSAGALSISVSKVSIEGNRMVINGLVVYPSVDSAPLASCTSNLRGSPHGGERVDEPSVAFEIASSLSMRPSSDRVVLLQNLSIMLSPDYLLLRTAWPRSVELDVGDGCRVQRLSISDNMLHFAGSSQIMPNQPVAVASKNVPGIPPVIFPLSVTEYFSTNLLSLWWASWTTAIYQFDLSSMLSSNIRLHGGLLHSLFRRK